MFTGFSTFSVVGGLSFGGVDEGVGNRVCEKLSQILFLSETLEQQLF